MDLRALRNRPTWRTRKQVVKQKYSRSKHSYASPKPLNWVRCDVIVHNCLWFYLQHCSSVRFILVLLFSGNRKVDVFPSVLVVRLFNAWCRKDDGVASFFMVMLRNCLSWSSVVKCGNLATASSQEVLPTSLTNSFRRAWSFFNSQQVSFSFIRLSFLSLTFCKRSWTDSSSRPWRPVERGENEFAFRP